MKTKLEMVQEYIISEIRRVGICAIDDDKIIDAWKIADVMYAESDKREKSEKLEKRNKFRELLNSDNTFIEREGQHFDDIQEGIIDESIL